MSTASITRLLAGYAISGMDDQVHRNVTGSEPGASKMASVHTAEIHFHLLPGLDDGPASMEQTVALAAAAAAEGTRTILATPHVNSVHGVDVSGLPELAREVRTRLARERIPVEVHLGAELAHYRVPTLSDAELELIAAGPPGRRWLLVEASLDGVDWTYNDAADELRARGVGVVMAHPERAMRHHETAWPVIERELAAGTVMQVNAWSVCGRYGKRVRRDAFRVLEAAPVAAIASDAHGRDRLPALRMAVDALTRAGDTEALTRVSTLPQGLLERGLPVRRPLAA
jgi:protein-tyrosine phosphatase